MPEELFIDIKLCLGCKSCELACATEHSAEKDLFAAVLDAVAPRKRIFVCPAGEYSIPLNCRHCEEAPCLRACPAGAFYRQDDTVVHLPERCIGCGACQMACPFGVITRLPGTKTVAKCDNCPDRAVPACAGACPTGAIKFGTPSQLENWRRLRAAQTHFSEEGGC